MFYIAEKLPLPEVTYAMTSQWVYSNSNNQAFIYFNARAHQYKTIQMQRIISLKELFIILSSDDKQVVENLLHKTANNYFEQQQCMHAKSSIFGFTNSNMGTYTNF